MSEIDPGDVDERTGDQENKRAPGIYLSIYTSICIHLLRDIRSDEGGVGCKIQALDSLELRIVKKGLSVRGDERVQA